MTHNSGGAVNQVPDVQSEQGLAAIVESGEVSEGRLGQ